MTTNDTNSGQFDVLTDLPKTAEIKPVTRKMQKPRTTKEMITETTKIGLPIFLVVGSLFTFTGLLFTVAMNKITEVGAAVESMRKVSSDDHDKLIRVETMQAVNANAAALLELKVQALIDKKR